MQHVDQLSAIAAESAIDLARHIRTARRQFFTPEVVGHRLARAVADAIVGTSPVRIGDPFAGDGRLLEWLVELWPDRRQHLALEVWDTDDGWLEVAVRSIGAALDRTGQRGGVLG